MISNRNAQLAMAGAMCAAALATDPAHALTCAIPAVHAPRDGDTNVPINALLWSYEAGSTRLSGPSGVVPLEQLTFPVSLGSHAGFAHSVLVPATVLEPNTQYTIEVRYPVAVNLPDTVERHAFTTGAGVDTTPPALPEVLSVTPSVTPAWTGGLNRALELEVSHDGILIGDSDAALGNVSTIEDLLSNEDAVSSDIEASSPIVRWLTSSTTVRVGLGDCLVWPEDSAESKAVRFGVMDVAGNFSGWREAELSLPSTSTDPQQYDSAAAPLSSFGDDPSSCSLSPSIATTGMAPIALVLTAACAAIRRSRRG